MFSVENKSSVCLVFLARDKTLLTLEDQLKLRSHEPNESESTNGLIAMRAVIRKEMEDQIMLGSYARDIAETRLVGYQF